MNINFSRISTKQKKAAIALTTLTCGLIGLIGYEVFSNHHSYYSTSDGKDSSGLPILIDDDVDDESVIADLSYSIGRTPELKHRSDTIKALKLQIKDLTQQLSNLRTQLLTRSFEETPLSINLKKELAEIQENYQALLEKKELLKDELIRTKEQYKNLEENIPDSAKLQNEIDQIQARNQLLLEKKRQIKQELIHSKDQLKDQQKVHKVFAQKKKELKDHYAKLEHRLKERIIANKELVSEIELLRDLLEKSQQQRKVSDASNIQLIGRINTLKDEQLASSQKIKRLQNSLAKTSDKISELKKSLKQYSEAYLQSVDSFSPVITGKNDNLTLSILPKRLFETHSLAVNFTNHAPESYDMWKQVALLNAYGIPETPLSKELREKIQELQENLGATHSDNVVLQSSIFALNEELNHLKVKHALYEQELKDYQTNELNRKDKQLAFEQELELSGLCSGSLENVIGCLNQQIKTLQQQLIKYRETLDHEKLSHSEKEKDHLGHNETLSNKIEFLNEQLASVNRRIQDYELILAELIDNDKLQDPIYLGVVKSQPTKGNLHTINALYHLAQKHHSFSHEEYANKALQPLQSQILELKEQLNKAKEEKAYSELNYDQTYQQLSQLKNVNQDQILALENQLERLEHELRHETLKNQYAPGILPTSYSKKLPETKLENLCAQVTQIGSTLLLACNKSSEELINESNQYRLRADYLEEQIQTINEESQYKQDQIEILERELKELTEEKNLALENRQFEETKNLEVLNERNKSKNLENQIEQLLSERSKHEQRIIELENEIETLLEENASSENIADEDELSYLEEEEETRNLQNEEDRTIEEEQLQETELENELHESGLDMSPEPVNSDAGFSQELAYDDKDDIAEEELEEEYLRELMQEELNQDQELLDDEAAIQEFLANEENSPELIGDNFDECENLADLEDENEEFSDE